MRVYIIFPIVLYNYTKHRLDIHVHVPGKSCETKKVHVYNETRVPLGKMTFNKAWMARQEPTQHYPLLAS